MSYYTISYFYYMFLIGFFFMGILSILAFVNYESLKIRDNMEDKISGKKDDGQPFSDRPHIRSGIILAITSAVIFK